MIGLISQGEWEQECEFIILMCVDEGKGEEVRYKEKDRKISSTEFEERENV